jgi:glycosyltransferase involved in cell wall biosynthesis
VTSEKIVFFYRKKPPAEYNSPGDSYYPDINSTFPNEPIIYPGYPPPDDYENLVPDTDSGGDKINYSAQFYDRAYGLSNSSQFIVDFLLGAGLESIAEELEDHEEIIQRLATLNPDTCVIEALWVRPERMRQIVTFFPSIKFYVRVHSHFPFLSAESVAMQWFRDYKTIADDFGYNRFQIASNHSSVSLSLTDMIHTDVKYLPNLYRSVNAILHKPYDISRTSIHIGCFGATRILKNTLNQAVAAIAAANALGRYLYFHINASPNEELTNPIVRNLIYLFDQQPNHFLMIDKWAEYSEFINTLTEIDLNLQSSFTETFNLVSCDSIYAGIPVITSNVIDWLPEDLKLVNEQDTNELTAKIIQVFNNFNFARDSWENQRTALVNTIRTNANLWLEALQQPFNYNDIVNKNSTGRRGIYVHYDREIDQPLAHP